LNNYDLAKSYIRQAEERIKHAREAVELLLKAALRYIGIEPPKLHDVGPLLRKERDKFPAWFREKIDEFAYYSRVLRSERERAMYGDEETGTPADELYSKFDAENATKMCDTIYEFVKKLIAQ
jgi:Uncharacterized conserved protein related to C-terminal domain of eukaryotic chaperone, SACSIN